MTSTANFKYFCISMMTNYIKRNRYSVLAIKNPVKSRKGCKPVNVQDDYISESIKNITCECRKALEQIISEYPDIDNIPDTMIDEIKNIIYDQMVKPVIDDNIIGNIRSMDTDVLCWWRDDSYNKLGEKPFKTKDFYDYIDLCCKDPMAKDILMRSEDEIVMKYVKDYRIRKNIVFIANKLNDPDNIYFDIYNADLNTSTHFYENSETIFAVRDAQIEEIKKAGYRFSDKMLAIFAEINASWFVSELNRSLSALDR